MRYETKRFFAVIGACALLSGCGITNIFGKKNPTEAASLPADMGQGMPADPQGYPQQTPPDQYPPQQYPPQQPPTQPSAAIPGTVDAALYDEVGYAGWYGNGMGGAPTASGEPFNPGSMSAAHASLPIPSFVEITNLDTGRTLLVRINDRIQGGRGHIIDLSQNAAAALGMAQQGIAPVRIRRVNPPEDEKTALALGSKGAERLDTPEPLLVALRKKLGSAARPAAAPDPASTPRAPVTRPPVETAGNGTDWNSPGAHYGTGPQPPRPRPRPPKAAQPRDDDGDFVVENGNRPARQPRGNASAPSNRAGGIFVQIAAMSNPQAAASVARQSGGHVVRSGNIYRVRVGPFANEVAARAAQAKLAAKGYREARLARW